VAWWLLAGLGLPVEIAAQEGSPGASPGSSAALAATPPPCERPLQELVDEAPSGGTISLPACTSDEPLRVTRPLVIDAQGTVIDLNDALPHGLIVEADDVTVIGLSVRRAANEPQDGAVRAWDVDRFAFREGSIEDSAGACISVARGADAVIEDSTLTRCGQEGIHATRADGLIVRGNRIRDNNPARAFDPEWEAGGAKVTVSTGVTFEANEVFDNGGPGIWCDIDCRELVVRGNRVWGNDRAGIMVEISDGAVVEANTAWENGWGKQSWGWGAGILVSSSRSVVVRDNVVAWNADGIVVVSQDRPDAPVLIRDVRTTGNTVAMLAGRDAYGLAWLQDWPGTLFEAGGGSGGSADRFWFDRPEDGQRRFAWDGGMARLDDFRETPGGRAATYVSDAELASILASASVPGDPLPDHPVALPNPRELVVPGALAVIVMLAGILVALVSLRRRRLATVETEPRPRL
jgi:hypothetical protein